MVEIKPQAAIEYAYQLGNHNQAAIKDGKLSTNQIQELWEIQTALGFDLLEFNRKEEILKCIKKCIIELLIRNDKNG